MAEVKNRFDELSNVDFEALKGTIQFGKYKGQMLKDVWKSDRKYCMWMREHLDPRKSKHKSWICSSIDYYIKNE